MRLTVFSIILVLLTLAAPIAAQEAGTSRVIVALNTEFRTSRTANPMGMARALVLAQAENLNARVAAESDEWAIPYVALEVDPAGRAALESSPFVAGIYEDTLAAPTLAESVPIIDAPLAWSHGFDGTDQAVVILDSGIDATHPFFNGRVITEACFSTNDPNAVYGGAESLCPNGTAQQIGPGAAALSRCTLFAVSCNHGTHVAGIAAGNNGTLKGVAPGAKIIAIQIFTKFRDCNAALGDQPCILTYTSDQINALNHVYNLSSSKRIAAVNMSLGGSSYSNQALCDAQYAPTKAAIDLLRSVKIATIVSSGNDYSTTTISAPACISTAIAVGATSDDDRITRYSNINSMVDLVAPGGRSGGAITGTGIVSSFPGGIYGTLSGTSMAAPHVAGAWAILKQAAPNATVGEILAALQQSGVPITDGPSRDDGYCPCSGLTVPRIDVDDALNFFVHPPPMPVLNTPDDWALLDTTPTLRWVAVDSALTYTVQIATDTAFTQLLPNYPLITTAASHTPLPLTPGGTYYWRVRSVNSTGFSSDYSAYRRLFINGAPHPGLSESSSITITWGPITWATKYEIWRDTDPKFTAPFIDDDILTPEYTFNDLSNGTYYWRVRAINAETIGAWSAAQSFTIKTS